MNFRSNHYVPRYYLLKWYDNSSLSDVGPGRKLKVLIKKSGKIIYDVPKNIAQRNNLYTFPKEFKFNDNKINEKLLVKQFEDWYLEAMSKSFDKKKIPNSKISYKLAGFVIVQSFRTLSFKRSNEKIISENFNFKFSPEWHQDYSLHLSFLIINGFPVLIKNAIIIFHKAPPNHNFVTSDNPASYWVKENNNYKRVISLADNHEAKNNPNLRIICPLNPLWCAELKLFQKPPKSNLLTLLISFFINPKRKLRINREIHSLDETEFINFQSLIYQSADKIIIGLNEDDLKTAYRRFGH